jgi:hypothetical protein
MRPIARAKSEMRHEGNAEGDLYSGDLGRGALIGRGDDE